jgi:hypothetical protein
MPKDRVTLWITLIRRPKKNNPSTCWFLAQDSTIFFACTANKLLGLFVPPTASITASQQIYTKSRIPSNWLQSHIPLGYNKVAGSSWNGLKSTHIVSLTRVTCVGPGAPPLPSPFRPSTHLPAGGFIGLFLKCQLNQKNSLFFVENYRYYIFSFLF